MIWLAWRQFRVPALATLGALVVVAVVVGTTGIHLHHLYGAYQSDLPGCHARGGCEALRNTFLHHYHHLYQWLGTLMVAVPGLIGIFWGPPLVARELETGSHRLAWTQSITRTRWLAVKLALVAVAAVLAAGLLSLMVTWWAAPVDHVTMSRFSAEIFSERGLTPIGYAAFAFMLGVTFGLLIGRTLPAMAATLVGFVLVRQVFSHVVRPHLLPAAHAILPLRSAADLGFAGGSSGVTFSAGNPSIPNAMVVSSRLVDSAGHTPSASALSQFLRTACPAIATPPQPAAGSRRSGSPGAFNACVGKLSAQFHEAVAYQPASRYWELQWCELAAYLALALILTAGCLWWIRHRLH